jgi:hypothetical protein
MNRIVKFSGLVLMIIIGVLTLVHLSFNVGYVMLHFINANESLDKCTFAMIGTNDIWCSGFGPWLFIHFAATLLGFLCSILSIAAIVGLFYFIKFLWQVAGEI